MLMMLLDLSCGDVGEDYRTLLGEMKEYSEELLGKPRIIVGTKLDAAGDGSEEAFRSSHLEGRKIAVSSVTRLGIEDLKKEIVRTMEDSYGR
jgi:GTPase involved in cell partitioning and DNA repair